MIDPSRYVLGPFRFPQWEGDGEFIAGVLPDGTINVDHSAKTPEQVLASNLMQRQLTEIIIAMQIRAAAPPAEPNPHIGLDDPDDDTTLDEFIATDVESVHFEALDDCRWYANIKLADGQHWTLNFGSRTGRAKGYANAEQVE